MGLYQDPQAGCSSRTGARDVGDILYRRHPPHGRVQGETERPGIRLGLPAAVSGVYDKHEKTALEPSQSLVFLGFTVDTTKMELRLPPEKLKKSEQKLGANHSSGASTTLGENERHYTSNSPSAPVLPPSTDGLVGGLEGSGTELRDESQPLTRQQGGADLVEYSHGEVEWEVSADQGAQPHDRL